MKAPNDKASGGFTLIEMMISVTVAAMILGAAYGTLMAGFSSQKMIEPRLDTVQKARVALALITADLRCACPLSKDDDFLGAQRQIDGAEADNLDFGTHNFTPNRPRTGDFCQVSYYIEKDPKTGELTLWRRRNPRFALNPLSGGAREAIVRGVASLQLEYYDGDDWYDTWGDTTKKARTSTIPQPNASGLPVAVRMTLALNIGPKAGKTEEGTNSEPTLVFRTVAPLELAALFQDSSPSIGGGGGNTP